MKADVVKEAKDLLLDKKHSKLQARDSGLGPVIITYTTSERGKYKRKFKKLERKLDSMHDRCELREYKNGRMTTFVFEVPLPDHKCRQVTKEFYKYELGGE